MLALLAYSNSFSAGFVFDNKVLITEDTRLHAPTADNLALIFHRSYWWPFVETALYRPVTTLTYLVNYSVLGNADRPLGYHVVNLVLHAGNTILLFLLALRLTSRVWPAFFAAAMWTVHPLGTEAVTNIIGRADLLAGLGVLGAFFSHLRARDASGKARLFWTAALIVATTIGVFSKESAVTVVAVAVLYDLTWRDGRSLGRLASGWIPMALPLLLFWYQRSTVITSAAGEFPFVDNPIVGASFWQGRLTALSVLARYVYRFVWPVELSADYSFPQIPLATGTPFEWAVWISAGLVTMGVFFLFRRSRVIAFCLACAFVTFLPASNLLFASGTIMAERLMYLPSAFLSVACGVGLFTIAERLTIPGLAPAALCLIVSAFGVRTYARNPDWSSDLSLWTATAKASPRSFKSHGALAEALYNADGTRANLNRVIAEKEESLALLESVPDPSAISKPYREAATYYLEYGEWLQARDGPAASTDANAAFERSANLAERFLALLAVRPGTKKDQTDGELILSTAYQRMAKGAEAVEVARRAQERDPFNPLTYRSTAAALLGAGHDDVAAVELMTGFIVTGNAELRSALVDLYRGGLDARGCAVKPGASGVVLDSTCDIVRHDLCLATTEASRIFGDHGRADLADQARASVRTVNCTPVAGDQR